MKQIANAFYAFTAQLYAQGYANSQPVARRTADWVKSEQPRTWTETTTNALELSRSTRSTYSMHKWRLVKQQSEVKKVHKKISYLQENHDATFSTVIACCAETGSKRTANAENCSPRGAEKSGAGTVPLRYCPMRRFAGKPAFLKGEKKTSFDSDRQRRHLILIGCANFTALEWFSSTSWPRGSFYIDWTPFAPSLQSYTFYEEIFNRQVFLTEQWWIGRGFGRVYTLSLPALALSRVPVPFGIFNL